MNQTEAIKGAQQFVDYAETHRRLVLRSSQTGQVRFSGHSEQEIKDTWDQRLQNGELTMRDYTMHGPLLFTTEYDTSKLRQRR